MSDRPDKPAPVSVAELPSPAHDGPDRTPPQDIAAEQSVLGAMMLSKDAIADVVEVMREGDFYRPAHSTIYSAILDLYGKGEPADAVTVSHELTRTGDLARIGGAPYLHTLVSMVPTAANAEYYARIVRERAILRRLVEAGTRIVQMGYTGEGEVDDVVDRAQAEVYEVTERRTAEDYLPLRELMDGALTEIEAISNRGGQMVGVPTGFADLDSLTNGLHPGQLVILAARPALGKALALDTPIPTPTGWTSMGAIKPGDEVLADDGTPTRVRAVSPVWNSRPCYRVTFSDGSSIVADAEHEWLTDDGVSAETRTTAQIAADAGLGDGTKHRIKNCEPLWGQEIAGLPDVYTLGVLSAGGSIDPEVSQWVDTRVTRDMSQVSSFLEVVRGSVQQRRDFLSGYCDAAGEIGDDGTIQVSTTSKITADFVYEIAVSLGQQCTVFAPDDAVQGYTLRIVTSSEAFRLPRKALLHKERTAGKSTARIESRFITSVEPVGSVPVKCIEVSNESHLYLAGRAMIPTHNSTLGLDIARSASIKHNLTSVIFSLEMSRNEIIMRLLSAEAQVALHHMRSGSMTDGDWTKLASKMGVVSEAPLFIDDSPNLTMMEIRAKCRRLKQRHDLRLVIVDYMQLMTSGKKVESRQQEVSEFSRSLKLLAKELDVPVIAISQLNRGPEQRTDKRPMLADLRESGCLTASTRIMRADIGSEVSLGDLLASGERDIPVWSLDDSLRYVRRTMTHVFPTGRKEVFRMTTASGRVVELTTNHPLLTYHGWVSLGDLAVGDRIATPRHVPAPEVEFDMWGHDHIVLLAHLLGDGSMLPRQPLRYATQDPANLEAVREAATRAFDVRASVDDYPQARCLTLRLASNRPVTHGVRNPINAWLDDLGLFGKRSHEKFVPPEVFCLPKVDIALFLRHLWATDGSIQVNSSGRGGRIYYSSTSRRLADDVARLLLRFGITARIRTAPKKGYRPSYMVDVSGAADQKVFLRRINAHGARGEIGRRLLAILETVEPNTNKDTIPREVWTDVKQVMSERGMTHREFATAMNTSFCGSTMWKHSPSRERLAQVATVLDSADLELLATNDVYWDEIISITSIGEQDVYDATVLGTHNFIADGVAVHNSLEQDADMVILLHREDAYERESPRAGEADFIVAKHRNGPTSTVTVAFQGHYSRFVDMAGQ